ncbi:MAG: tetratricopeptide repeat protein [Acidobacteriia bacterium]|nr:tetratricopeptide repeat protein [Terriglobia bacterium]
MRRVFLIFLLSLPLKPQVAQESWTQGIETLIVSGNLSQARQRLEQETAARGETSAVLYFDARILFEEHRYAQALQVVQRSLAMVPTNPELYKLAALSAIRMDRLDIAEPALKTAAQLAPNDYLVHFHLGALYYTESLFLSAKPELEKAAQLNPSYMPALLFLGLTLEEVGDEKTTIATYRKAIEMAAAQRTAREMPYVYLGRFYYRLNRFEEGLPLLDKAVEINPSSGEGLLELGKTLHALKRDSEAVRVLERAAVADALDPEPHYLLFRILESQSREQAAQDELHRFQALSKQKPASDTARRRLQSTQ